MLFGGLGFMAQPVIRTGVKKGDARKIPPCYKPDLGNFRLKIALEADGGSHGSRRHLDEKKDAFLRGLGWTVLRFTNEEILNRPDQVATKAMSTILRLTGSTLTPPTA